MGPNLSSWALSHRSFIIFLMVVSIVAGAISYVTLGRDEDPPFTFRTMVVQANWPGASMDETLKQVTERLERTLQEVDNIDFLRSFTSPGVAVIFVNLDDSTDPEDVPDLWYDVRKRVGDMRHTLPQGVQGPFFNDEFGDTFGIIYGFTTDGFGQRELRDYVEDARSRLLSVQDVSTVDLIGAQDEQIFIDFNMERLAALGLNQAAILAGLAAQNVVRPAGIIRTGEEQFSLRVSGAFASETDVQDANFMANGRLIRLRDVAEIRRGYADPPRMLFRVNGTPAIGLAIAMSEGGDVLALGENVQAAIGEIKQDLPVGITPVLVANQPQVVDTAINEFMVSLWQAIGIILVVSFIALGVRAGLIVALSIPLTLAIVFPIMQIVDIDLQRISLGALIISLSLLVDNAMTTIDVVTVRLAAGDDKVKAASYAYESVAMPMLTGTFITAAGFVPIGFAQSAAGEYTFSIFAVVTITLLVSWMVAVLLMPLLAVWLMKAPEQSDQADKEPGRAMRLYNGFLYGALKAKWLTVAVTVGAFVLSILGLALVPRQFFPASDRPELARRPHAAAQRLDPCERGSGRSPRGGAEGGCRCRELEHVHRPGRDPLLPATRRAARQSVLQPARGHREGRRGARPAAGPSREAARGAVPERDLAGLAARARPAGGMAGAIPGVRRGRDEGARDRASSGAAAGGRARAAHQLRLDRAGTRGADPGRPGPGAAARCEHGCGRRRRSTPLFPARR